jgi:hypothetical protein
MRNIARQMTAVEIDDAARYYAEPALIAVRTNPRRKFNVFPYSRIYLDT